MRLAQIVEQKKQRLPIPDAFRRMLGLYEGSNIFINHLRDRVDPQAILTTIPPDSWLTASRIFVLLRNRPGALSCVAQVLEKNEVNVLLMEGYGYLPEKLGWWSAVVDFPSLHKIEDSALVRQELGLRISSLLENFTELYPGTKLTHFPEDPSGQLIQEGEVSDGYELAGTRIRVSIEPMALQKIASEVAEHPGAGERQVLRGNTIKLESDVKEARNLLMCNTEERFIRVMQVKNLAEIILDVHTEANDPTKIGVGVLSRVTNILRTYHPLDSRGRLMTEKCGINILFTYNYITYYGPFEEKADKQENARIRLFLEMPVGVPRSEQVRVWRDVFELLLEARREEKYFVRPLESRLIIWQKRGRRFKGNDARKSVEFSIFSRVAGWVREDARRLNASILGLSTIALAICYALEYLGGPHELRGLRETLVGVAFASLLAVFSSRFNHK